MLSKTIVNNGVRESLMQKLTLEEYVAAKDEQCLRRHKNCSKCSCFVNAGNCVLENKFVYMTYLWNKYFKGKYESGKAQWKILQMLVAAISVSDKLFIVEESQECNNYEPIVASINICIKKNSLLKEKNYLPRKDYEELLSLGESAPERELLKHTICRAYNMSKRSASKVYGIGNVKRAEAVKDAALKVAEIKQKHKKAMKLEQEIFLDSCGLDPSEYLTSSSGSSSDSLDGSEVSLDSESGSSDGDTCRERDILTLKVVDKETSPDENTTLNKAPVQADSTFALEKLRQANFNWFVFIATMETRFRDAGSSTEMLDQFLDDFSSKLLEFNLCEEEVTLTQTSRTLYLDKLQQMETYCQNVSKSSENSDEESCNETDRTSNEADIHEAPRQKGHNVKNKLRKIRDRFQRKCLRKFKLTDF